MKSLQCTVPGCPWHTRAEETAEVVRRAVDHLRTAHDEEPIRPDTVERLRQRVTDVQAAA